MGKKSLIHEVFKRANAQPRKKEKEKKVKEKL